MTYNQRHFGVNKLYVAIDKDGRSVATTMAMNIKEARTEFRRRKIAFVKIRQT